MKKNEKKVHPRGLDSEPLKMLRRQHATHYEKCRQVKLDDYTVLLLVYFIGLQL